MAKHVLYRFYSRGGRLLYVGITMNPFTRFGDHRRTQRWWDQVGSITLTDWESREMLRIAEYRTIRSEQPLYNITHSVHNPEWVDYVDYCPYCSGEPSDTRQVPYDMFVSDPDDRVFAEYKCFRDSSHEFWRTFGTDIPIVSTLRHWS